jgi:hypothetical protein
VQLGSIGNSRGLNTDTKSAAVERRQLDALSRRADLALRLKSNALCFQAAVIDAGVYVEFGQSLVGKLRPAFAPALYQLGAVPLPDFWAKAARVDRAHGEHDMGMRF